MTQDLINEFIDNPNSYTTNLKLANYYEDLGQLGSAVTHYLKAADIATDNNNSAFIAVSGAARTFIKSGGRENTVEGLLKRAVALNTKDSEAYYQLALQYEHQKRWHDCYLISSIGLEVCKPVDYRLYFQKGVSAWWIGSTDESREILHCLNAQNEKIAPYFRDLVRGNIYSVGNPNAYTRHSPLVAPALKRKFNGATNIQKSYAQSHQDLFALLVADGKKDGFYLEIGSGDPELHNNTCLLEREFNWKGISIDLAFSETQRFRALRKNICLQTNALEIDYKSMLAELGAPKVIDYLQIDIDPPQSLSMDVLLKIPFDEYTFRAITFEHNAYEISDIREKSRAYLESKGYKLVVSDIACDTDRPYEDWYIHSSVPFNVNNIDLSAKPKTAKEYFYDLKQFNLLYTAGFQHWLKLRAKKKIT
jgi:hypothetical protein